MKATGEGAACVEKVGSISEHSLIDTLTTPCLGVFSVHLSVGVNSFIGFSAHRDGLRRPYLTRTVEYGLGNSFHSLRSLA